MKNKQLHERLREIQRMMDKLIKEFCSECESTNDREVFHIQNLIFFGSLQVYLLDRKASFLTCVHPDFRKSTLEALDQACDQVQRDINELMGLDNE